MCLPIYLIGAVMSVGLLGQGKMPRCIMCQWAINHLKCSTAFLQICDELFEIAN